MEANLWILAEQGVKGAVTGLDNIHEMIALLACTLSGSLLPPQLINAWKTTRCLPLVDFPAGLDVWHSNSHWSTEETMLGYVQVVIAQYTNGHETVCWFAAGSLCCH